MTMAYWASCNEFTTWGAYFNSQECQHSPAFLFSSVLACHTCLQTPSTGLQQPSFNHCCGWLHHRSKKLKKSTDEQVFCLFVGVQTAVHMRHFFIITNVAYTAHTKKQQHPLTRDRSVCFFFNLGQTCLMFMRVLWCYVASTFLSLPNLAEGTESVSGQLECPVSGVTSSGSVEEGVGSNVRVHNMLIMFICFCCFRGQESITSECKYLSAQFSVRCTHRLNA